MGRFFSHLNSINAQIISLQETYLSIDKEHKLKPNWIGQVFHAHFSSKARGTAILIQKNIPFTFESKVMDPNGRFLLISGQITSYRVTFLNIYDPIRMIQTSFITFLDYFQMTDPPRFISVVISIVFSIPFSIDYQVNLLQLLIHQKHCII